VKYARLIESTSRRNVVILGGGIIGASIAYYLSKRGVASTIVERSAVASAASGEISDVNLSVAGSHASWTAGPSAINSC
jgi:glycine/D-amino acid oxidase-like deaminating enzyme